MDFSISTLMMVFFIISLVVSMWKVYAFLPNKELADDDTTKESQDELINIMLDSIKKSENSLTISELFKTMKEDENFDEKHYWRFNENKLKQLLQHYYILHKEKKLNTIDDIKATLV